MLTSGPFKKHTHMYLSWGVARLLAKQVASCAVRRLRQADTTDAQCPHQARRTGKLAVTKLITTTACMHVAAMAIRKQTQNHSSRRSALGWALRATVHPDTTCTPDSTCTPRPSGRPMRTNTPGQIAVVRGSLVVAAHPLRRKDWSLRAKRVLQCPAAAAAAAVAAARHHWC